MNTRYSSSNDHQIILNHPLFVLGEFPTRSTTFLDLQVFMSVLLRLSQDFDVFFAGVWWVKLVVCVIHVDFPSTS